MSLCTICLAATLIVFGAPSLARSESIPATAKALLYRAGNADADSTRLRIMQELQKLPGLSSDFRVDIRQLKKEVERWLHDHRLDYFSEPLRRTGSYPFGIAVSSPLYPITQLYQARMLVWVALEYGDIWSYPERRVAYLQTAREIFVRLQAIYPHNRIIQMYLGRAIAPAEAVTDLPEAPAWANFQREALRRLTRIISWWIDNRVRQDGDYGGGWGDDCEMWRFWMPVLIAFDAPEIVTAQERFSRALLSQAHMQKGYTARMSDVEHTAEDAADTITPMMFLQPDNPEWTRRAQHLGSLMRDLWTGINQRGFRQFKSTYFTADQVDLTPRRACDTVYHPRAVQPTLLYWQRSGDPDLRELFTDWMDAWVDATARSQRGKPAGIIPSAIHWPDGDIGGLGDNWWQPGNYTDNPLYLWPSAMSMMTNTLLLTHVMTGEDKYLQPIRSMVNVLRQHADSDARTATPGSRAWCAAHMRGIIEVALKYQLLTGNDEFDDLFTTELANPYVRFRLRNERPALTEALRQSAMALRVNFPGYTSEVRYTDRVTRFPSLFALPAMYPEPQEGFYAPDTQLLFSCLTGEPGDGLYFPINAVRWLTRPDDIAILVSSASAQSFAAEVFHFGDTARDMGAEFYLLAAGHYRLVLADAQNSTILWQQPVQVDEQRTKVTFQLPPKQLCTLTCQPITNP
jgi:hypothetical protein